MNDPLLERFSRRASADPLFLGFRLAAFAAREGLDDEALAARLGCDAAALMHVRLCRAPRLDSNATFREDVTCVADKFGLNVAELAAAAKAVPVAPARDASDAESAGAVLAARDRNAAS